ncbi:MAG TPA: hydantoinase/oxoprolinase N-terminal domain-containing protein, partial [Candidatus Methylomirabilis sp.]|nr:hydantoinase/oxoprolinase N-terminal domain-containing protein [Candidatus Methylomirabilis sp.]
MPPTGTIAIDVGGTFTDVTFADAGTGATWVAKTPSTPGDLSGGFITAIRKVLALAGRTPAEVLRVFHGTTTATNAILEGKTPPTALVTTAGFKYVLEIGRHDIPRHGNLYGWSKPQRPITPDRVFEVRGRLDSDGAVLEPLDEAGARAVARQLGQLGVPAVAVVFLHAYANPAHERRMQEILAEECPGALVSLSSEVLPQFREFERSMATALNAAVMPPVSRYVGVLR